MQEVDVKRGHWKNVDLDAIFADHFGEYSKTEGEEGTWYTGHAAGLKNFRLCMKGKASLLVEIDGDMNAPPEAQMNAVSTKNKVLEAVTGFTAKQRAKRAQDAIKKAA